MKETNIIEKIKGSINKIGFALKKHSPEILVAAGIAGTVASAVMACKATLKVNDILAEAKDQLNKIHDCTGIESFTQEYTDKDARKDTALVYVQTSVKLIKLYVPSVTLGVLSLGSILTSNNILRKRHAALAAAYAAVDNSFKKYRKRVAEHFGDDAEHQIRYGVKSVDVVDTVVDENGKEEKIVKNVETVDYTDPNDYSPYARFFDEASEYWEKDSEYNLMFLHAQQNFANDKLRANGRLFLNEVYEMLGIPKTKAGQVVGWVYDKDNPIGDNYVDFGIYDIRRPAVHGFVNGYEPSILLDFNVDGNIWELMT